VPDLAELVGPVTGENDLQQVLVDYWLRDDAYQDDFLAHFWTEGNIRIWSDAQKTQEILPFVYISGPFGSGTSTGTEYRLADLPGEVWIESIGSGTARLALNIAGEWSSLFTDMATPFGYGLAPTVDSYQVSGGDPGFTAIISLLQLGGGGGGGNLTAYRPIQSIVGGAPSYAPFSATPVAVAEGDEADFELGPGIRLNTDFDNGSSTADRWMAGTTVPNENDLIRIDITGVLGAHDLVLVVDENLQLFPAHSMGTPIFVDATSNQTDPLTFANNNRTFYVGWAAAGHDAPAFIQLIDPTDPGNILDTLVFHTFTSIVIGYSGETAFGGDWLAHPTRNIADDFYNRGYDVHYYDVHTQNITWNHSTTPGQSASEVRNAIANRGVSHVGLFGWSHGGGAVYEMTRFLSQAQSSLPSFTVDATAYIDAVSWSREHPFPQSIQFEAERRSPLLTLAHANWYQYGGNPFYLNGTSIAGALPNDNLTNLMTDPDVRDHLEVAQFVFTRELLLIFILDFMPIR